MNWFRDNFIKRKLLTTIAVVSTGSALAEIMGNRGANARSADNTIDDFAGSRCFELLRAHSPAANFSAPVRMNGEVMACAGQPLML